MEKKVCKRWRLKDMLYNKDMLQAVEYAVLPDARLNKRLALLVEQLSAAPEKSIPQACGNAYDSKAAYRFLG
jgi:hypothetical protein